VEIGAESEKRAHNATFGDYARVMNWCSSSYLEEFHFRTARRECQS
jgi:hypothetical protein